MELLQLKINELSLGLTEFSKGSNCSFSCSYLNGDKRSYLCICWSSVSNMQFTLLLQGKKIFTLSLPGHQEEQNHMHSL